MTTLEIPEEGMKVLVIVGEVNGSAIWREVGKLLVNRNGKVTLFLDKYFNPAGVYAQEPANHQIALSVKQYSADELKKRRESKDSPPRNSGRGKPRSFDDMDDDIPF